MPVFGVCPIAMNTPIAARSCVAPVLTSLIRAPVTPDASPSTSSSVWFQTTRMLPPSRVFAISLSIEDRFGAKLVAPVHHA